jgi:hypothetical protein
MKFNIYKIFSAALTFAAAFTSISLMAQGPGGPPGPPGGTSGPIDTGVFILLIGAAAYGYKELKAKETSVNETA